MTYEEIKAKIQKIKAEQEAEIKSYEDRIETCMQMVDPTFKVERHGDRAKKKQEWETMQEIAKFF